MDSFIVFSNLKMNINLDLDTYKIHIAITNHNDLYGLCTINNLFHFDIGINIWYLWTIYIRLS